MNGVQNERNKLLVRYRNELFDLTTFASKHPGGRNTLDAAHQSDIDYKFDEVVPHSDAAKYLINEYKVTSHNENNNDQTHAVMGAHKKSTKQNADRTFPNENGTNLVKFDESMEVRYMATRRFKKYSQC